MRVFFLSSDLKWLCEKIIHERNSLLLHILSRLLVSCINREKMILSYPKKDDKWPICWTCYFTAQLPLLVDFGNSFSDINHDATEISANTPAVFASSYLTIWATYQIRPLLVFSPPHLLRSTSVLANRNPILKSSIRNEKELRRDVASSGAKQCRYWWKTI